MKWLYLLFGSILQFVSSVGVAFAQAAGEREWGGFWHPAWGWGHMIFGSLMMIVFWGGIVVLVVLLVRWLARGGSSGQGLLPARRTPLEILQERFAKGEIDKEEFEERRRALGE
jgi:putative membrane protein